MCYVQDCKSNSSWIIGLGSSGAGADFVMMGGMLAGHDQCSGEVIEKNGKKYKLFYGMSSDTAMKKYVGGVAEYRWDTGIMRHIEYGFLNVVPSTETK